MVDKRHIKIYGCGDCKYCIGSSVNGAYFCGVYSHDIKPVDIMTIPDWCVLLDKQEAE